VDGSFQFESLFLKSKQITTRVSQSSKHLVKQSATFSSEDYAKFLSMKPIDKEMLLIQVTAVVGCYGLLRSQEIKNLLFKDITIVQRKSITIGYQGYISKSKTDKIGKGFVVFIPNESNGSYNPGEIITTYIDQVKGLYFIQIQENFWFQQN